jgi:Tfp pilus assembly protein PilO
MDRRLTAKFRWILQASLDSLGWPGITGVGLLAFCLVAYLSALLPAQQRLAEILAQAGSLRAQLARSQTMQKETPPPEAQLTRFYQFFPAHVTTPDLLEKLYAAAEASGIALEQGNYRLTSAKGDKIELYQITLPVKGSYPQIRKFIGRLLADLPAVSLDGVSFQRQKIDDAQVESQIKLTLHLGDGA